jgi:nuclear pore complex protein Nup205
MRIPRTHRNKSYGELFAHAEPLFSAIPALAERFYRVLHNLCMHRETSDFTIRYLCTREGFFIRQLAALPFQPPIPSHSQHRSRIFRWLKGRNDGEVLTSSLQLRSFVFDLVASDLHILTNRGHLKSVLELIYGNEQRLGG